MAINNMNTTLFEEHVSTVAKGNCFVFTNWNTETKPIWNPLVMTFLCFKLEEGEEQGGLHHQGYVQMACQMRERAVQRELGITKGWCKAQKARFCEAPRAYVCKLDTGVEPPEIFGEFRPFEQGKRNDILAFVEDSKTKTKRAMYEEHPACMLKYRNAYTDIRATFTEPRTTKTVVHLVLGRSGSGKSFACRNKILGVLTPAQYYTFGAENKGWWDGYDAHEYVIFEDMKGWMLPSTFLQLCDEYPMTVQIKGGRAQFVAKHILINSTLEPNQWWSEEVMTKFEPQEIIRRIDKVYWQEKNKEPVSMEL